MAVIARTARRRNPLARTLEPRRRTLEAPVASPQVRAAKVRRAATAAAAAAPTPPAVE